MKNNLKLFISIILIYSSVTYANDFIFETSKIEFIWENKIQIDFGIDVKKEEQSGPSPLAFYWQVLQKYGKLLGLWQATTYGHRGGLFQVGYF